MNVSRITHVVTHPFKTFLTHIVNNRILKGAGTMSDIAIDSANKTIHCSMSMDGEREPINVDIKYAIETSTVDAMCLTVTQLKTSRKWIDVLFDNFVPVDKLRITIPNPWDTLVKTAKLL